MPSARDRASVWMTLKSNLRVRPPRRQSRLPTIAGLASGLTCPIRLVCNLRELKTDEGLRAVGVTGGSDVQAVSAVRTQKACIITGPALFGEVPIRCVAVRPVLDRRFETRPRTSCLLARPRPPQREVDPGEDRLGRRFHVRVAHGLACCACVERFATAGRGQARKDKECCAEATQSDARPHWMTVTVDAGLMPHHNAVLAYQASLSQASGIAAERSAMTGRRGVVGSFRAVLNLRPRSGSRAARGPRRGPA